MTEITLFVSEINNALPITSANLNGIPCIAFYLVVYFYYFVLRTPFHADVFRSYSWSSNLCGRKKWIFYPPSQENYLKDSLGNLMYDVDSMEMK